METHQKGACFVVGLLGLLSAASSFAAEATKTRASQVMSDSAYGCSSFPNSPATGLAVAAVVTLLIAQIIICYLTQCICCKRASFYQSNSSWTITMICNVISWASFLIALVMLVISAANNNGGGLSGCSVATPGVFAGAGVLSLATVALGIFYYLVLESERVRIGSFVGTAAVRTTGFPNPRFPNQSSNIAIQIAMIQPQFPPPQIAMGQPQLPPPQIPPTAPPHIPPRNAKAVPTVR